MSTPPELEEGVERGSKRAKSAVSETPVAQASLSHEQALEAIKEMLQRIKDAEEHLENARGQAGGELGKIMELVVPVFFEIQGTVMQKYGFEPNDDGFGAFAEALQKREDNEEVKRLSDELQSIMKEATAVGDEEEGDGQEGDFVDEGDEPQVEDLPEGEDGEEQAETDD